jgi:DNA-binding beta-propeller fold protein YncE
MKILGGKFMQRSDSWTHTRRAGRWRAGWLGCALLVSLLLGCGGGGGGVTIVTVTLAPKAALVILGGTQQFFANISGGQVTTIVSANGAVRAANLVTITTTSAHGLTINQIVTISGVSDTSFNGAFLIATVPSTTTFTYAQTAVDATSGGGSVTTSAAKWFVNSVEGGNSTFGTISTNGLYTAPSALPPATTVTIASNGAVRSNNVVTITTTAAHNLVVGQEVTIAGVTDTSFNGIFFVETVPSTTTFTYTQTPLTIATNGAVRSSNVVTITTTSAHRLVVGQMVIISGVTDSSFNGTFTVASVPSGATFTYPQTASNASSGGGAVSASNATSGGGTVSTTAVQIKAVPIADNTKSDTAIVSVDSGIHVTVTPPTATLGTSETLQFIAAVPGTSDTRVNWFVNDIAGGDPANGNGTITATGVYQAPATIPNPATVTIKAVSQADTSRSGTASATIVLASDPILTSINPTTAPQGSVFEDISLIGPPAITLTIASNGAVRSNNVVTITTTAAHNLAVGQVVTISGVTDTSFNGTFTVASVPSSTMFTYPQTASNVTSSGGTVTSTPANFIATNVVNVNGNPLPPGAVSVPSSTVIRARIPASLLGAAGILKINVRRQGGTFNPLQERTLTVVPVRPALVAASPDSGIQGGGTFSFDVHGGYFGDPSAPAVSAQVDGGLRSVNITDGRRLSVTIGPPHGDLTTPGLVPVAILNTAANPPQAATNFAVQPSSGAAFAVIQTLSLAAGSAPSAIAVNTTTGTAVVANTGKNTVQLIDLTTNPPSLKGGPVAVGTAPTGVAIDNTRNVAVVVNSGSNSVSIVDLSPSPAVVMATITANIGPAPVAVAVNPLTGIAVVAYQNSNSLSLIDLATNTVVSAATVSTGPNPQVAVEPKLNWAVVTPGGAGSISIVETGKRFSATIASSGATRTSAGAVTITTTAPHSIAQGQIVLITGVADPSFNGTFTVTGVSTSTSFTYIQSNTAAATSGGGQATFSTTVATASVGGTTVRGISINPETEQAVLADPGSTQLQFFSVLDQGLSSITLEAGHVAAAFHPLTDIIVSVNNLDNKASIVDARTTPTRLAQVSVGTNPRAVVVDPVSNLALVANAGSDNVSVISLGALRPLHVTQINIPSNRQLGPAATRTSPSSLSLTITGGTFSGASAVRLDGVATGVTTSFVSPRRLTVTIDPSRLAAPRRYALDVMDGVNHSNVAELPVIQVVDMVGAGGASCTNPSPRGVAIDAERNLALVTNPNCNNVAIIDLTTGDLTTGNSKVVSVGTNPQGVAVDSRLGRAVVTNRGSGDASIVDLTNAGGTVSQTVSVGTEPLGVAIDPGTGLAIVANSGSNNLTTIAADTGQSLTTASTDQRPVAIAIDPQRRIAAVAHAAQNNLVFFDLKASPPTVLNRVSGPQAPTSVVFDPVTTLFVVNSSLGNNIFIVNPDTLQAAVLRVGINPTSLGYNYRSGTLLSLNTASSTISVVDFADQPQRVRAVIGTGAAPSCFGPIVVGNAQQFQQPPCGVEIHPKTNLAVLADGDNNRVLLLPLPR